MNDYWIKMSAYKTKEIPESEYLILIEIVIIKTIADSSELTSCPRADPRMAISRLLIQD